MSCGPNIGMAVTLGQNTKDSVQFASENSWFSHGWAVMPATRWWGKLHQASALALFFPATRHTGIYLMDAVFHGDC